MATGSVFRRCSCRDNTGKNLGSACPKLAGKKRHGQWFYRIELPADAAGQRRPRRRGGFLTATAAQAELDHARELLAIPDPEDPTAATKVGDALAAAISNRRPLPTADAIRRLLRADYSVLSYPTVGDWLTTWLASKKALSRNARRSYESHLRLYLIPHLGTIRLEKLRAAHLSDMFDAIVEHNDVIRVARASGDPEAREAVKWQRPVGAASLHRIRETLRAALNAAIKEQLLTVNVATHIELPPAQRPRPKVWTDERVTHWRHTGEIPFPVMVWTPAQTGRFLDHALEDRLYALYHLIAHRGLRRGEACGLRLIDTHLTDQSIEIANQIVQYGWETGQAKPKTTNSEGIVALDTDTVAVLEEHLARRQMEKRIAGDHWVESGLVFTEPDGSPLHPADVTERFKQLTDEAGLPPIRLHDLRHGAATLALAAGVEMKVVQEMLRHSSLTITSDTYTTVLAEVARAAAEDIARIIPRNGRTSRARPRP